MNTLYPLDDLPEGETGWTFWRRLQATELLGPADLVALQEAHLRHLVAHHAAHTPWFAQRLQAAGMQVADLVRIDNLLHLPVLERLEVQQAGHGLFSSLVPFDHLPVRTSQTSGSTGQPVVVRRTRLNSLLNEAATLRDHAWWGRPRNGGRITMVRPQFAQLAEVPAAPGVSANIAQQIPITTDVQEQVRLMAAFQPQTLLVYPNNLAALLDLWAAQGSVPASLRHLKTIGETVSPSLRAQARAVLGLSIEDGYSSEEMGSMALQCPVSGQYHVLAESHHVEVLHGDGRSCAPGETGRVVVTDLHNLATPMIRYAIGDWAQVGTPCACGRALPTLKRILGRERNLLRLPDGRRHWPLVGFQQFAQVAPVRQYQVVQLNLAQVALHLFTEQALAPAQEAALVLVLQQALGHPFQVQVHQHRQPLPLGPQGKFEEFVCRVTP